MKIKPKGQDKADEKEQLLAPDEFITTTGKAFHWLQNNARKVMTIIGIVFGVTALVGIVTIWQSHTNEDASLKLAAALKTYHRPVSTTPAPEETPADEQPFASAKEKYTAAKDALEPVVKEFGQSGVGLIATLYLADTYARLEMTDQAIELYRKYVDRAGGTDGLRFLALQGLGTTLETKGDKKGAAEAFQQMEKLPNKLGRDIGVFNAGRVLIAQAETKEEGKKLLEKLTKEKDYETSPLRAKAEELLAAAQ